MAKRKKRTLEKFKLSHKEKGFVKDIAKGKTGVRAALDNYDTKDYSTAASIATENLKKPHIIEAVKSIAEQIPDDLLVKRHNELLNKRGKRTIVSYVEEENEEGDLKMVRQEKEVDDGPDTFAVTRGLEMAYKLKGSFAPEKVNHNVKFGLMEDLSNEELARIAGTSEEGNS